MVPSFLSLCSLLNEHVHLWGPLVRARAEWFDHDRNGQGICNSYYNQLTKTNLLKNAIIVVTTIINLALSEMMAILSNFEKRANITSPASPLCLSRTPES